jgi:hypothetical protein
VLLTIAGYCVRVRVKLGSSMVSPPCILRLAGTLGHARLRYRCRDEGFVYLRFGAERKETASATCLSTPIWEVNTCLTIPCWSIT